MIDSRLRWALLIAVLGAGLGSLAIGGGGVVGRAPVVVVIDAGHGGEDPGAISRLGNLEKHLTLTMARLVATEALKHPELHVILTRNDDRFVELADRAAKAREVKAALFVSLHANAYSDPSVRGVETFVDEKAAPGSKSETLAACLQRHVLAATGSKDRGVRRAPLYLSRLTIPAALVEMGFMSHAEENALLHKPEVQRKIAAAIVAAIAEFVAGRR